ncbi:MAG TPA: MFS transporter [Patescibacteria group bacterium]
MARKILKQYLALILATSFFQGLHFVTYTLFLTGRKMDLLEINLINMLYMSIVFLLEVPTGSIADVFGRKTSMVLGHIFGAIGFLVYYFANNFWLFVLAEFILAIGATLLSGATDAWIISSMKHHRFRGDFGKIFRSESVLKRTGIIVGSLAGAYMGNFDLAMPWLISSFGAIGCALFCAAIFKEEYFEKSKEAFGFSGALSSIANVSRTSIDYGIRNKSILYVTLFSVTLAMSLQAFNMQWSLVLKNNFALMVSDTGWFFVLMSLSILAGNQLSVRFAKLFNNPKSAVVCSQIPTAAGMIIASSMLNLPMVMIGFIIHELGRGAMEPIKKTYLNERIPDDTRATVNSFDSMISTGGSALGLLLSGYAAKMLSIPLTWLFSGIFLFASIILFLKLRNGK